MSGKLTLISILLLAISSADTIADYSAEPMVVADAAAAIAQRANRPKMVPNLPDFRIVRLRVDASQVRTGRTADGRPTGWTTGWNVQVHAENAGGMSGLGRYEGGVFRGVMVPVMIAAYIPRQNAADCPDSRGNPRSDGFLSVPNPAGDITLMAWRYVPAGSGPIYAFSNVFTTNTNPPAKCVPETIAVNWDASYPDYVGTIDERDESNNGASVSIVNYPWQRTWTTR